MNLTELFNRDIKRLTKFLLLFLIFINKGEYGGDLKIGEVVIQKPLDKVK